LFFAAIISSPLLSCCFFSRLFLSRGSASFSLVSLHGGTRRGVREARWEENERRRKKARGVFVVGFTNASASIHGSLCVEKRGWGEGFLSLSPPSSLHCAQYKTDREEIRFFLGLPEGGRATFLSLVIRRVLLTFLCFSAAVPWIEVRASAHESAFSLSQGTEFRMNRCCWASLASTPPFFVFLSLLFFTVGEGGIRGERKCGRVSGSHSTRDESIQKTHFFSVLWGALDA